MSTRSGSVRLRLFAVSVCGLVLVAGGWGGAAAAAPEFAEKPSAAAEGGKAAVTFVVKSACDATVAVERPDGTVVRHLASGMLGANAPPPFEKNALRQRLAWDGTGDDGKAAPPGEYRFRVSLGLVAQFDRVIGWNPNRFGSITALAVGEKGELFVLSGSRVLVLDRAGKYVREVHPVPAGTDPKLVPALSFLTVEDGERVPQWMNRGGFYPDLSGLTATMLTTPDGLLVYGGGYGKPRGVVRLGMDGRVSTDAFSLRVVEDRYKGGQLFLAADSGRNLLYACGFIVGGYPEVPAHGIVRLSLDGKGPGPEVFAGVMDKRGNDDSHLDRPRGLCVDDAGNLYCADYGNSRIVVLNPDGKLLRQWACKEPVYVAVDTKRKAVYVLCVTADFHYGDPDTGHSAGVVLYTSAATVMKFDTDGKALGKRVIEPAFIQYKKDMWRPIYSLRMALDCTAEKPIIWIAASSPEESWCKYLLLRLEDTGANFGARNVYIGDPVEVADRTGVGLNSPKHLALDRKRDLLYVRDGGWWRLVRMNGDGGDFRVLDLHDSRANMGVRGGEMDVAPDGALHVSCWHRNHNDTSIFRFDCDGKPLSFPGADSNEIYVGQKQFHWLLRGSTARGSRGLCVSPFGETYVLRYTGDCYGDKTATSTVDAYGPDGKPLRAEAVKGLTMGAHGIRVDRQGHIYIADHVWPVGQSLPESVMKATVDGKLPAVYAADYGTLLKFEPEGAGFARTSERPRQEPAGRPGTLRSPAPNYVEDGARGVYSVKGAVWQFVGGVSPVPASTGQCVCSGARFDLDEFGRIFVPDQLGYAVNVLDSGGNLMARFGSYGNMDSRGAGSPVPSPEIAFASPAFVAASAKHCYVSDGPNNRVVRVRLEYAASECCPVRR